MRKIRAVLALAWALAVLLPAAAEQAEFKGTFREEMVAMRDGVKLATNILLPEGEGPWPVVLQRTPYGKDGRGKGIVSHDTRHSAVTNLVAAGMPDVVAMTVTGHKDPAVFKRYNVRRDDVQADGATALVQRQSRYGGRLGSGNHDDPGRHVGPSPSCLRVCGSDSGGHPQGHLVQRRGVP